MKLAVIPVVGVLAVFAFFDLEVKVGTSQDHSRLVSFYCSGAVSAAQERGCVDHVTAAQIDRLANEGDQTAVYAEDHYDEGEPDCQKC